MPRPDVVLSGRASAISTASVMARMADRIGSISSVSSEQQEVTDEVRKERIEMDNDVNPKR